jgi:hypothetical protein
LADDLDWVDDLDVPTDVLHAQGEIIRVGVAFPVPVLCPHQLDDAVGPALHRTAIHASIGSPPTAVVVLDGEAPTVAGHHDGRPDPAVDHAAYAPGDDDALRPV